MANRKDSKGRVLKTGENQRTNGTYEYKYRNLDGKRKSIYAPTLKELRLKEKEIQKLLDDGVDLTKGEISLGEWIEKSILSTSSLKKGSLRQRRVACNRIFKHHISNMKIKDIKEIHIQNFIEFMNGKYARNTINDTLIYLSLAFKRAKRNKIISDNPMDFKYSELVKKENGKPKKKFLTADEFDSLINFMRGSNVYSYYVPHFILLKETGLRIGEYIGLTVDCIDLSNKLLTVEKQVQTVAGKRLETPKTRHSAGVVPLTEQAIVALKEILAQHEKCASFEGIDGFFILKKRSGNLYTENEWLLTFERIRAAYNKRHPDTPLDRLAPHMLRHTAASEYLKNGLSVLSTQKILRHSNSSITLKTYAHSSFQDVQDELRTFQDSMKNREKVTTNLTTN